jgi:phage-related protein
MPTIGAACHELRVNDGGLTWRVIYHLEPDAVVLLDVFAKKTQATPLTTVTCCRKRLAAYRKAISGRG